MHASGKREIHKAQKHTKGIFGIGFEVVICHLQIKVHYNFNIYFCPWILEILGNDWLRELLFLPKTIQKNLNRLETFLFKGYILNRFDF